jgi:hypothetical protein
MYDRHTRYWQASTRAQQGHKSDTAAAIGGSKLDLLATSASASNQSTSPSATERSSARLKRNHCRIECSTDEKKIVSKKAVHAAHKISATAAHLGVPELRVFQVSGEIRVDEATAEGRVLQQIEKE